VKKTIVSMGFDGRPSQLLSIYKLHSRKKLTSKDEEAPTILAQPRKN
jgi:hypothetical protein